MSVKKDIGVCQHCGQTIYRTRQECARHHQKTIEELYGSAFNELALKSKTKDLAYARFHYWFLLVIEDLWSLPEASKSTGHKHHAALYGVRRIEQLLLGTHPKKKIENIRIAYWTELGLSPEEIKQRVTSEPSIKSIIQNRK